MDLTSYNSQVTDWQLADFFTKTLAHYPNGLALASSFGPEDLVLMHHVITNRLPIRIFILDTGRLPAETYELIDEWEKLFKVRVEVYFPDSSSLQSFAIEQGINPFFRSYDLRKQCCTIRKVEPLQRALANTPAWFTGLRAEQSPERQTLEFFERDHFGRVKIAPLLLWRRHDVWRYIKEFKLPFNRLHLQGYASIGCAPCSRAISQDEPERAGRWWWEEGGKKECGLHQQSTEVNYAER